MNKQRNLIYDIGMHEGEDTEYYLKKGFNVVAFEANPTSVANCKKRFSNEIAASKLIIIEGAIVDFENSDTPTSTIQFYKNKENSVWGTVVSDWAARNERLGAASEIIEVPTINFAESLRQHGIPYYLKIDIEGMDVVCLKALLNFEFKPDYISIESEKVSFSKLREEFNLFAILGYHQFHIINQSKITSLNEPKDSAEGKYLNYRFLPGSSGLFGTDLPHSWRNEAEALAMYKRIYRGYELLGDGSNAANNIIGRALVKLSTALFGYPGWYDTHARHLSVQN